MTKLQKSNTPQIKRQKKCLSKQQTSASLINSAFNDHWIDALSFYHLIKRKYRNSRIYSYSAINLSIKTGISPYLVAKYINQLRDQGMLKWYGRNLQFISIYKIKQNLNISTKKFTIWINENHSISDIKAVLTAKYLEFKASQQVKRIDEKIDQRNLATGNLKGYSYKKIKELIRKSRDLPTDEKIDFDLRISYLALANELNTSKSAISRLIKRAKELNKVKVISGEKNILHTEDDGITFEMFKAIRDILPVHAWYNKLWHSVIVQMPNIYRFIEYKIEAKKCFVTS